MQICYDVAVRSNKKTGPNIRSKSEKRRWTGEGTKAWIGEKAISGTGKADKSTNPND